MIRTLRDTPTTYNLVYKVNGFVKETLSYNITHALARYIKQEKTKERNYKNGKLEIVPNKKK